MLLALAIILAIATIIGIVLEHKCFTCGGGVVLSVICSFALIFLLMVWSVNYADNLSNIQKYHAVKQTIEESRNKGINPMERATLTQSIIEINSWLKNAQYWNGTIFDQAIPDEVMELKPIK